MAGETYHDGGISGSASVTLSSKRVIFLDETNTTPLGITVTQLYTVTYSQVPSYGPNGQVTYTYTANLRQCPVTVIAYMGTDAPYPLQYQIAGRSLLTEFNFSPSLSQYGSRWTNQSSVPCFIRVTYFDPQSSSVIAQKDESFTLNYTSSQAAPVINDISAFTFTPVNTGAVEGLSGYIQNYSKIKVDFDITKVTTKLNAGIGYWGISSNGTGSEAFTQPITSASSYTTTRPVIIAGTRTIVFFALDSRNFQDTDQDFINVLPYHSPTLFATVFRCNSSGQARSDGSYLSVSFYGNYSYIDNQNSITVSVQKKLTSASSFDSPVVVTGVTETLDDNNVDVNYTKNGFIISGFLDANYDVRVSVMDALGRGNNYDAVIAGSQWALHVRNRGIGAAFGKISERDNELDIGDWKLTCGGISSIICIDLESFSTLPKTITNDAITSDHKVIRDEIGNPSALSGDLTVTTTNGSMTISGTLTNATTMRLILAIPGTEIEGVSEVVSEPEEEPE